MSLCKGFSFLFHHYSSFFEHHSQFQVLDPPYLVEGLDSKPDLGFRFYKQLSSWYIHYLVICCPWNVFDLI